MGKFVILKLALLSVFQLGVLCSKPDKSKLLNAKLFKYDSRVVPKADKETPVTVNIGLHLYYLAGLDVETEKLSANGWLIMKWMDPSLQWNPEEFEGAKMIFLNTNEIWTPDIALYESASQNNFVSGTEAKVVVKHTGEVLWVPPVDIQTICPIEPNSYEYHCNLTFGSWVRSIKDVDVLPDSHLGADGDSFLRVHHKWELVDMKVTRKNVLYRCCPERYPAVVYTLHFKRRQESRQSSPHVAVYCNH
ncbi:neuronal acetylcholine receptor subunit alpha-9-I-like [Tachypleus tridentatus]|uniref:neuronal acetylcholine receptor subunit alpha-9-I-like n=1 Tax=Tachypleus tridentatus TaxID=6853 RepID=UPI003FD68DBF